MCSNYLSVRQFFFSNICSECWVRRKASRSCYCRSCHRHWKGCYMALSPTAIVDGSRHWPCSIWSPVCGLCNSKHTRFSVAIIRTRGSLISVNSTALSGAWEILWMRHSNERILWFKCHAVPYSLFINYKKLLSVAGNCIVRWCSVVL